MELKTSYQTFIMGILLYFFSIDIIDINNLAEKLLYLCIIKGIRITKERWTYIAYTALCRVLRY